MSETQGLDGEYEQLLLALRRIEDEWRRGFRGNIELMFPGDCRGPKMRLEWYPDLSKPTLRDTG